MNLLTKINTKMVLIATLVVCIGFVVSTLLLQRQVSSAMIEKERLSSRVISGFVVQRIIPAIKFRKPEKVEEEFAALAQQKGEELRYAAVFTTESVLFASFAPDTINTTSLPATLTRHRAALAKGEIQEELHDDRLRLLIPILNDKDNSWLGTLVVDWSLATIQTQIHSLVFSMLTVAIPVVIVIIACLIVCMRLLVVNPINRISLLANELAQGEGDLRRRIEYERQDELRELCDGINQFITKVHSAMTDVTQQSSALTGIARDSRDASESASRNAQDQHQSLDQMAAAITEMSVSIRNVAEHAAEGETTTADAHKVANEVQQIIERNRESIGSLAAEVERAASAIQRVSDDSQQIGHILEVIRGIAEQTNLLALNAAIEAARAGEQGRGFAVVADEVRSLANKTQQSTEEIKAMIHRLQSGSQDAAAVMDKGRDKARIGVEQADQTRNALQNIHSAVQRIANINREIARATQDQSQAADSLSHDIVQLSDFGQSAAQSAERAAQVSGELSGLIQKIQATLNRFRV